MRKIVLMVVILTMISTAWVSAETVVSQERRSQVIESQSNVKKAPVKENDAADKKIVENGSAADSSVVPKENGKSNVTVTAKVDSKKKNIYHGVSVYTTRNDTDDEYNAALLDAKRNAVEQAGTYLEVKTEMKNFEITADDVKVMSSAVVRLVPNTIRKEIVSSENGVKKIRVEADFEVNVTVLGQEYAHKIKDLDLIVSISKSSINNAYLASTYRIFKKNLKSIDATIELSVWYYENYKRIRHEIRFGAYRADENEAPVVISEKYPLTFVFYPKNGDSEILNVTPEYANNYIPGDSPCLTFAMQKARYIANWAELKVIMKYYRKDGTVQEVIIPQKVLNQWRDMILSPQNLIDKN